MGLNLKRLASAALVLAALLLPLRKLRVKQTISIGNDHSARMDTLRSLQWSAEDRSSAFEERDSALARLAGLHPTVDTLNFLLDGFQPGIELPKTRAEVAARWKRIGPVDSTVSAALLVYHPHEVPVRSLHRNPHREGTRSRGLCWDLAGTVACPGIGRR